MKYQIEMLNVAGADSFIINYYDEYNRSHLVIVDAGNYSDGEKLIRHLNKYYPKQHIDLAIVTHPDKDHFGGFVYLLETLKKNTRDAIRIEHFVINDPGNHITADDVKYRRSDIRTQEEARSVYTIDNHKNLLGLIDSLGIAREEWLVTKDSDDTKYEHFFLLGPSEEYFEELVPNLRHELEPIAESVQKTFCKSDEPRNIDEEKDDDSSHNASSLIFLFLPDGEKGKKFLFTGDATRESFDRIWLTDNLSDCDWLKVPHHGSIHNMTTELIEKINPSIAYISAPGNDKHPADEIIDELKNNGAEVYSTHYHGGMLHQSGTSSRLGWKSAKPL